MLMLVRSDARYLPVRDGSVQTCVTSPPYWGLRDYGTATWDGGNSTCPHRVPATGSTQNKGNNNREGSPFAHVCGLCGARRIDNQLGLEATPDAYVASMVAVFREVRRALRDDGTCWLNLGDSYAGAPVGSFNGGGFKDKSAATGGRDMSGVAQSGTLNKLAASGIKPKDLVGIPWRVAFALQADGWYLRSDIIWSKPNPMPESVTDRPTKAHEYVFLLAKSDRYYFDADAVREANAPDMQDRAARGHTRGRNGKLDESRQDAETLRGVDAMQIVANGRNIRSVWHIATQPYAGAHFATMPEKLVERCVLAGSKAGDVVLDPFVGSGTVARVALRLGRKAIGLDLNHSYLELADDRTLVSYGLPFDECAV